MKTDKEMLRMANEDILGGIFDVWMHGKFLVYTTLKNTTTTKQDEDVIKEVTGNLNRDPEESTHEKEEALRLEFLQRMLKGRLIFFKIQHPYTYRDSTYPILNEETERLVTLLNYWVMDAGSKKDYYDRCGKFDKLFEDVYHLGDPEDASLLNHVVEQIILRYDFKNIKGMKLR